MIVKLVAAAASDNDVTARVYDLGRYIRAGHAHEKLLHSGTRGMLSEDPGVQLAEMAAVATSSARTKQPIQHYVLSWREGEQPTPAHVEQAVDILMAELGLEGCHAVYGLHGDTANTHLHVMVSRIHPDAGINIKVSFAALAASRAVARIEDAQGWQPEAGAMFEVAEDGAVVERRAAGGVSAVAASIPPRIRDAEVRTGEQSALRIAQEQATPILSEAKTWAELHERLGAIGMRYITKGSGAEICVGDTRLKASSVHRSAALGKMQARLGTYEPAVGVTVAPPPEPRPIDDVEPDANWLEYQRQRREAKTARERDYQAQRAELAERRARLKGQSRAVIARVQAQDWKGRGAQLNILRMSAAAETARQKASLRDFSAYSREKLRMKHPPFPGFEDWLRGRGNVEAADRYRYRGAYGVYTGDFYIRPMVYDIRDFSSVVIDDGIDYFREREYAGAAFRDEGRVVRIFQKTSDSMLAALQLSAEKWPEGILVKGSEALKRRTAELAVEHGFTITNPELQGLIAELRAARDARKADEARPSERSDGTQTARHTPAPHEEMQAMGHIDDVTAYCRAVGADHYRITSIRLKDDGGKLAFVLGKREGQEMHDASQLTRRIPELQRLESRGENIYLTPISETVHHILVDDMTTEKLQQLRAEGYAPAVILESSPGNFQVVLNVSKLGLEPSAERDAVNRLITELNKKHGDAKLSGAVHPHRAPGFGNQKPKHRRADGSYPKVGIIEARGGVCLAARQQLEAIAKEQARQQRQRVATAPRRAGAVGDAYAVHLDDIQRRGLAAGGDLSRIDAMIAVRLRATGHSQEEVEAIIEGSAPSIRSAESTTHDWPRYARATAAYAFGARGDIDLNKTARWHPAWRNLEGQQPEPDRTMEPEL